MKAKYILEALLLKGMKIVLDSAKEAFIVLQIHSNETYWVIFKHYEMHCNLARGGKMCLLKVSLFFASLLVKEKMRRLGCP